NKNLEGLSTTRKSVQEEIVKNHNQLRRMVSPPGSDLLKMVRAHKRTVHLESCICSLRIASGFSPNSCEYEDRFSNCAEVKAAVICEDPIVNENCKATYNCEGKIH
ncbi:hypothetical protein A6R68_09686, partial [Neotoma lepida]